VTCLFLHVLNRSKAFAGVKADYDKVEDFFLQSSRFFERLSLIQNKTRDVGPLQTAIVRVFATQLTIFGDVEKNTKKEGARFSMIQLSFKSQCVQDTDLLEQRHG
jgi:hypothetical protein